jgi:hypothetical protein
MASKFLANKTRKSNLKARRSQQQLISTMQRILDGNQDIRDRLARMESSTLKAKSSRASKISNSVRFLGGEHQGHITYEPSETDTITINPPLNRSGTSGHSSTIELTIREFEHILAQSRVYRNVKNNTCDISFQSSRARTHAWSVFSVSAWAKSLVYL